MEYRPNNAGTGYFTNNSGSAPCNVLGHGSNALGSVNDPTSFYNTISGYLYGSDYPDSIGAAFIVNYMLGQDRGIQNLNQAITDAQNSLGRWQILVNSYQNSTNPAVYGVNWNNNSFMTCSNGNVLTSAYSPDIGDDVFYTDTCSNVMRNGMPEIVFYWSGGFLAIGKPCGNIQDMSQPYQPLPPTDQPPTGTISIACVLVPGGNSYRQANYTFSDPDGPTSATVSTGGWSQPVTSSPGSVQLPVSSGNPYGPQTVTLTVNDVLPGGAPGNASFITSATTTTPCVTMSCGAATTQPSVIDPYTPITLSVSMTASGVNAPSPSTISVTVTPPTGAPTSYPPQPATVNGSTATGVFSLNPTKGTGIFKVSWTLTAGSYTKTCPGQFPVIDLPYLNVYGGDIAVGGISSPVNGSVQCSTNQGAGIFSWNNANFSGGGAQYAVQVLGSVAEGFASAQDPTAGNNITPPTDLSFANQGSNLSIGAGIFADSYNAAPPDCGVDFTANLGNANVVNGTKTFGPGVTTVASGPGNVWYVKGDVYINNDIVYAAGGGGWASVASIPYFKLVVVGGNIYIAGNVHTLDGIYIAEPDSTGANGIIYTCTKPSGAPWVPHFDYNSGYYAACNNQLVVNGSFVAKQVQLLRTYGSVGAASPTDTPSTSHAAEVFNYTPEVWLPRGGVPLGNTYNAITGLPPIL